MTTIIHIKLYISLSIFSLILILSNSTVAQEFNPLTADDTPELIVKNYVIINVPKVTPSAIMPVEIFNTISTLIPKTKAHSLLNWKSLERPDDMLVKSYNRIYHFGRWINDKRDKVCHNTRAKVLIRNSSKPVIFKSENNCTVESGEWNDPYTNTILTDAIAEVQVDHLVPLKNTYVSGAYAWDYKTRCLYGNYLGADHHLKPIDAVENMRKSDSTPARYIPSHKNYRCTYIKNWLMVKVAWNLEMTPKEAGAIKKIILEENCDRKQFQITDNEIKAHQQFFKKNLNLCAEVANAF